MYRAVDTAGQTIDFLLTAKRDAAAELRFFRKAIRHPCEPDVVTIDKNGANTAALATLNADKPDEEMITVTQSKCLNNFVEQDHRNIKRRSRTMLGFKSFRRTQTVLAGIELAQIIRKGQLHHPAGEGLSPAEQFLCWSPNKLTVQLSRTFLCYRTTLISSIADYFLIQNKYKKRNFPTKYSEI